MKPIILSVHGIGDQSSGPALKTLKKHYPEFEQHEIVWNEYAKSYHWRDRDKLNLKFMSCYTVSNSHFTGEDRNGFISKGINYLLDVLFQLMPFFIFWGILLFITLLSYDPDYCTYIGLLRPFQILIKTLCANSFLIALSPLISGYFFIVGLVATLLLLTSTFEYGINTGLKSTLKSVVLKSIPNMLFIPICILFIIVATGILQFFLGTGEISDPVIGKLRNELYDSALLQLLIVSAIVAVAFGIFYIIYSLILKPLTKVILDVSLFLSDETYRTNLHSFLSDYLTNEVSIKNRDIIILAHSLGSVISVDSLLHKDFWLKASSIKLITMGSPLYNLIQRFFPRLLTTNQVSYHLQHRLGNNFQWYNIFRPYDPVGTKINAVGVTDISTSQFEKRLSKAHTNYLGDNKVVQLVKKIVKDSVEQKTTYFKKKYDSPPIFKVRNIYSQSQPYNIVPRMLPFLIFSLLLMLSIFNHAYLLDRETNKCIYQKEIIAKEYGMKYNAKVYIGKMRIEDPKLSDNIFGSTYDREVIYATFDSNQEIDFIPGLLYLKLDSLYFYMFPWATINKQKYISDHYSEITEKWGEEALSNVRSHLNENPIEGLNFGNWGWSNADRLAIIFNFMSIRKSYEVEGIDINEDLYILDEQPIENSYTIQPRIVLAGYPVEFKFEIFLFIAGLFCALVVSYFLFRMLLTYSIHGNKYD